MPASSSSAVQVKEVVGDYEEATQLLDDECTASSLPTSLSLQSQSRSTRTTSSILNNSKRIITLALLRKRSEHNEGLVSSLEELALHQEELQSIGPILGRTCGKTLKILLLQNNVIERMIPSELKLFRSLEYLNLALNNITKIEGIGGMEWLRKLDLTLNFIHVNSLEESVNELSGCRSLEELYLLGNPCMGMEEDGGGILCSAHIDNTETLSPSKDKHGWDGCRAYIVARLPNLQYLDGKMIKRSERILAMQQLPSLTSELHSLVQSSIRDHHLDNNQTQNEYSEEEIDERYISDDAPTFHDPKTRTKISNEQYDQKQAKEKQEMAHQAPKPKGEKEWEEEHNDVVNKARERDDSGGRGIIKQCNQGKYQYWFDEDESLTNSSSGKKSISSLVMRIAIPKHLSTSLVDVDIHPTYVSVIIKSKILRVVLPVEVRSDKSIARRSAVTGNLELVMPKADGTSEGVIGLGHSIADHVETYRKTTKDSSGCSKSSTKMGPGIHENVTLKKRECLGQSLLNDAGGVHLLNIVRNQGFDATNAADRCCDDDDDDDDEPPALS
ncbi:hypothetical protein ACHAWU_003464 [Discostella pseudostelligera]|uniref:Dynein axonemal assembly factor 11-like CS domain-containing protein n=1 Tax=Discostella pseudostelligera TaxID=259834 RepID=A0ABD3LXE0_9STRA